MTKIAHPIRHYHREDFGDCVLYSIHPPIWGRDKVVCCTVTDVPQTVANVHTTCREEGSFLWTTHWYYEGTLDALVRVSSGLTSTSRALEQCGYTILTK